MGNKIFVSYKYGDEDVSPLKTGIDEILEPTKVRDYIDKLQEILKDDDHINKGEADNESMEDFKDSTIASKLRDKIYDSSTTIMVISPNMKEAFTPETNQWIPWEIAYSLKEHTRNDRTSTSNAVLAVVLPDQNNSYSYYIEENTCTKCNCRTLKTDTLFQILCDNMFNIKSPSYSSCDGHIPNTVYMGDSSYIQSVKWCDFSKNMSHYIDKAIELNNQIHNYNIVKTVK